MNECLTIEKWRPCIYGARARGRRGRFPLPLISPVPTTRLDSLPGQLRSLSPVPTVDTARTLTLMLLVLLVLVHFFKSKQ